VRNLELKAACDEATLAAVSRRAESLGARQTLWHRDTYFAVPHGRLKLREIQEEGAEPVAELIGYERPDLEGSRWSSYYRATIAPGETEALRAALTMAIGERIVVEKRRDVVIARHTRIHLDTVERLGHFIELETVISDNLCEDDAAREHAEIIAALGIGDLPPIGGSYSDLLEAAATKEPSRTRRCTA
jgi:adenylate cyclase class IV